MGLAASQARLLTITARKADCEFLSMNLSHQKLALSRSMERVSSEYQDSLNKTKLVYDYYGAGNSDMALTYGLLMSPSVYNDYYPKLVSDSKNRIVLNSAYAQAARAAGIPAEGLLGTPSSDVRNNFIESLANYGIITPTQAVSIQGVPYNNALALGNGISASANLTDVTYDQLIELFELYAVDSNSYGVLLGSNTQRINNKDDGGFVLDEGAQTQHLMVVDSNGNATDYYKTSSYKVTIADLLKGETQYNLAYESGYEPIPYDQAHQLQLDIAEGGTTGESILDWITAQFTTVLGGTAASDTAIQYAYNCVYDLVYPSNKLADCFKDDHIDKTQALNEVATQSHSDEGWDHGFHSDTAKASAYYMGFNYLYAEVTDGLYGRGGNEETTVSVNLNNLAKAFLTSYVQYMEGVGSSEYNYQKGLITDCNLYDPKKDDFMFTIVTDTEVDMGDSQLYANFYDTLFNQICVNGWTENAQIDDQEYMAEMLKSGMVYISSMSDDGYYYQGNYSADKNILEVTDEEAIAKAEAKYNTEKTKIENKEQTIDLKMKNLDTEISSLTTEYDATKGIISKSIEKGFKRYEA